MPGDQCLLGCKALSIHAECPFFQVLVKTALQEDKIKLMSCCIAGISYLACSLKRQLQRKRISLGLEEGWGSSRPRHTAEMCSNFVTVTVFPYFVFDFFWKITVAPDLLPVTASNLGTSSAVYCFKSNCILPSCLSILLTHSVSGLVSKWSD